MASNSNICHLKRKALVDVTNLCSDEDSPRKTDNTNLAEDFLPIVTDSKLGSEIKHDLKTGELSYDKFSSLMQPENDLELINLLTEIGLISNSNPCLLCGGFMHKFKEGDHWFWICRRRVDGVKCQRNKKSIRTGTIFGNSQLSLRSILQIIWHFVHHLSEQQCVEYTKLSSKNNTTIVKWYKFCREVCTEWFWNPDNTPKLGGFGQIVEMDESFFPGQPKYNRGRRLGEDSWKDGEKWGFGLVQRGCLDAIIEQVPSNRSRSTLIPIIDRHCLLLDDCEHFSVNHSKNFVNPETGAHTQTIEGLWRHCKAFLPTFGMKSKDLNTYIGSFLWHRYCKQRKLDMFIKFLKCAAELLPPVTNIMPNGVVNAA